VLDDVLDFRQGLVDAKEDHQDFTIYPDPEGSKEEKENTFPHVAALAPVGLGGSIDNHESAADETENSADPEENLDDDGGDHSPEGPKVAHKLSSFDGRFVGAISPL
jgi:hypothetical protein